MASTFMRFWMAACLLLALAGCGGGSDGNDAPAQTTAASSATGWVVLGTADSADRVRPLAVPFPLDTQSVFDWAEWKYPALFPRGPASMKATYLGVEYTVRAYATGNYLGITASGDIYGLGPFTANQLLALGNMSAYDSQIRGDTCSVYPESCPTQPTRTRLNECQPLATQSLVTGTRFRAEYVYSGLVTGTQLLEAEIVGPAVFQNQNAVLLNTRVTDSLVGQGSSTTTSKVYLQDAGGGLSRQLGEEETVTSGGRTTVTRTVFDPPYLNTEFTLERGESMVRTTAGTDTPLSPAGTTTRFSQSTTYTFVTRETIVVRGRSFDTCRYTEQDTGSSDVVTLWYHVGTGLPVRISAAGGQALAEMQNGTINGQPL